MPSGILCMAMAQAIGIAMFISFNAARNVTIPSGKLCIASTKLSLHRRVIIEALFQSFVLPLSSFLPPDAFRVDFRSEELAYQ